MSIECPYCEEEMDVCPDEQDIKDLTDVPEKDIGFATKRLQYLKNKFPKAGDDEKAE